jgi:hypothetical protein
MDILGLTFTTVSRETANPKEGLSSARLTVVTKNIPFIGPVTMQGALTLGELTVDPFAQTATLTGGYPFTGMPQKLTGYFKYQPVNNDTCVFGWGLMRWNNGVQDTIGYGAIDTMGTFTSWTYFEVPLEYAMWETPDTMNIGIVNSNPLDGVDHTGTKLWVDNLSFEYSGVAIEGLTFANGIKIYAEPFSRQLVLETSFTEVKKLDISLFSITGQLAGKWNRSMQTDTEHLSMFDLDPGVYVIRISSGTKLIESRKITILY